MVPLVRTQQSPKYISNDSKTHQDVGGLSVGIQCWWRVRDLTPIEQHIAQWPFVRKVVWTKGCTTLYTELPCHQAKWRGYGEAKTKEWSVFCLFLFCLLFLVGWLLIEMGTCICICILLFFLRFNFYLIFYYFFNFSLGGHYKARVRGGCVGTKRWVWFHGMKFPKNKF